MLLAQQLRYAETLARCSRVLLEPPSSAAAFQRTVNQVAAIIRETVGGDHIAIARYPSSTAGSAEMVRRFQLIARDQSPNIPELSELTLEEVLDMPPELNVWREGGGLFNGPVVGRFSNYPHYQQFLEKGGIQAIFIQSLEVGGCWWGHILLKDCTSARTWDPGAVQLIQTAADMIVTYTESWEATKAFQEGEALLREVGAMAQIGGWTLDLATQTVQWSPQVYVIHDWDDPTPPSVDASLSFYDPEMRPLVRALMDDCATKGIPWDREVPFTTAASRRIWVRVQGQPVFAEGRITHMRGTIQVITERKMVELALIAGESKYRALFEMLPVGVVLADERGLILEANSAAERLLKLSGGSRLTRRIEPSNWHIVGADGASFLPDQYPSVRALRDKRVIADVEMGVLPKDGKLVWLSVSAAPLPFSSDDVVITYNDITARKVAEQALAAQLRYAEALAQCSRILLVEGNLVDSWDAVVQRAVAALRTAIGCTRLAFWFTAAPGAPYRMPRLSVADQSPETRPFEDVLIQSADISAELRHVLEQGQVLRGTIDDFFAPGSTPHSYFAINGLRQVLVFGTQIGGIWRGYMVAADRRDDFVWDEAAERLLRVGLEMIASFIHQWETNRALRLREEQLRAVGNNLPRGFVYQFRRDSAWKPSFTYLSGGVEQVLGIPHETIMDDAEIVYRLMGPLNAVRSQAGERKSAATLSDFTDVIQHTLPTGETRWLSLNSRPRQESDGSIIWDGVAIDVTENHLAARELERARDAAESAARAKSAFLASISHEIRTPLNAVIGMAALLRDTNPTAEQRGYIDTIMNGGRALLTVINDILDFSRLEAGRMELTAESFDLHACLSGVLDLVAYQAREKGLSVACTIAPDVPRMVIGDVSRLWQVLLNLLSNAVKFTNAGSVMLDASAIRVEEQRAILLIQVRDTGIGIAAERLAEIFDPFVQSDALITRRYGGTGLGLAICRQIIALMGGTIDVESTLGRGSIFRVRFALPIAPLDALPMDLTAPSRLESPLCVLIAEDNPINQEVTRRLIERLGHEVTVVADGREAVAALQHASYDIVLMDVQMPGMDGEEATQRIRALGAAIRQPRIVALSANVSSGDREQYLRAGMDDCVSKPIEVDELQRVLRHVVSGAVRPIPVIETVGTRLVEPDVAPLLDLDELARLKASLGAEGASTIATVVQLFTTNFPTQFDVIEKAIAANDQAQVQRVAHRLRGACLQIGARALAAGCKRIEQVAGGPNQQMLLRELRDVYAATLTLIQQLDELA